MGKVGVGAAAASCVVVLGLWIGDVGAGTGRELPASAGNDGPTEATPTVDGRPPAATQVPISTSSAPAQPVGAPAAAASTTAVIVAEQSGDHRNDDQQRRPNAPGQSQQHVGGDANDDDLSGDPGPVDEG